MTRIRALPPIVVGILFIALAFAAPEKRPVWIALGIVFIGIGARRLRAAQARATDVRPPGT